MELVTGHLGVEHVSSSDDAILYNSIVNGDNGDVVFDVLNKLQARVESSNKIIVDTGACLLQGHFAICPEPEIVDIQDGTLGESRIDLIVARYTLEEGNIQEVRLQVVTGTPTVGTPKVPAFTKGIINNGDTVVDFPLWSIPISGLTVETPIRLMPILSNYQSITKSIKDFIGMDEFGEGYVPLSHGGTGTYNEIVDQGAVFAGPSNYPGKATWRSLEESDLPNISTLKVTSGVLPIARGGTGAATISPNNVFAAPSSGTAYGAPSWRKLVAADIPSISTDKLTSGTLGVARGGTGKTTHTSNAVLTGNGTNAVNNVATASGALYATAANGAAKFGVLPIAQGGTGQSGISKEDTAANIITLSANLTLRNAKFYKFGKIAMVCIGLKSTIARSANSVFSVGSLASGKCPIDVAFAGDAYGYGNIYANGQIYFALRNAIGSNGEFSVSSIYLLK